MDVTNLESLNKQAIAAARQHMGAVAWPTVLMTAGVVSAFVANLILFSAGALSFWIALPVFAVLTYFSYTPLHEAAHGNINGVHDDLKWLNALCGFLVAPIISIPYASHKLEHFTHHRFTNQEGKDPDYCVRKMGKNPWSFFTGGITMLWVQNTFLFKGHWASMSALERAVYLGEIVFSLGWRVVFVISAAAEGAFALIAVGYLFGAFFTVYWFAYRPHLPYENPARYRNTNSMFLPKWLRFAEWFWLGQNIHSVHHLFPRVPFYRYHALHREIEPIMRAHGTPMIEIFSKRPA